jgi:coproporphyrinogen III oxidase-like Fe-S oxidoreductase
MDLLARLLERSAIDPRHNVPLPGRSPRRPWSGRDVVAAWQRLGRDLATGLYGGHYYNLYVHLPFCPKACTFCLYDHEVSRDDAVARAYVDGLLRQLEGMSQVVRDASFQNLLVGGGTPTWLGEPLLREVLEAVFNAFRFSTNAAKVVEANPGDITASLAALLQRLGVNVVSLGVHSLDADILAVHDRSFQRPEQIESAIGHLRDAAIPWVECDLLVGLWGDSAAGVAETAGRIMGWAPDGITLTKLRPKPAYLARHFEGDFRQFRAVYDREFAGMAEPLVELCGERGYHPGHLREDELSWKLCRSSRSRSFDERRRYSGLGGEVPSSTLGLGRFAHSKICGQLIVENRQSVPELDLDAVHYHGVEADWRYEASRWISHRLVRQGQLDRSTFRDLFGEDLAETHGHVLAELEAMGEVTSNGETLRLRAGDDRRRFVVSRLFFDRQTAVQELSMEDWDVLHIRADRHEWRVRVDHLRAERPSYFAIAGSVGLLLEGTTAAGTAREKVVLGVLHALLKRVARSRPWLSALEVADWLAAELPAALASRLRVTVEQSSPRADGRRSGSTASGEKPPER